MSEFKPGDLLTDDDGALFFVVDHVPVDRDNPLYSEPCVVDADGNGWRRSTLDPSARRLVVLDPEDREQVERLTRLYLDAAGAAHIGEQLGIGCRAEHTQAALREFASPAPPRPGEPTGLGAVVRDAHGVEWVRVAVGRFGWVRANEMTQFDAEDFDGARWEHIDAVEVLSEGVVPS